MRGAVTPFIPATYRRLRKAGESRRSSIRRRGSTALQAPVTYGVPGRSRTHSGRPVPDAGAVDRRPLGAWRGTDDGRAVCGSRDARPMDAGAIRPDAPVLWGTGIRPGLLIEQSNQVAAPPARRRRGAPFRRACKPKAYACCHAPIRGGPGTAGTRRGPDQTPPHARGSTPTCSAAGKSAQDAPARAGTDPQEWGRGSGVDPVPRACGDAPWAATRSPSSRTAAPHARG